MKYFVTGLVVLLSFSCSNNSTNHSIDEPVTIKIANADFIDIDINKLFACSDYVFLETNDSIALAENIQFLECVDEFYVLDAHSQKKVYRFDKTGKFLNYIGKSGQGPGEFVYPIDALKNEVFVEILAGTSQTVLLRYTLDGEFVEQVKFMDRPAISFVKDSYSSDYLFYYSIGPFKILKVDNFGLVKDSIFYQDEYTRTTSRTDALYSNQSGKLIFNEGSYNLIQHWTPTGFQLKYILDFGDATFSYDGVNYMDEHMKHSRIKGFWNIRWIQENTRFLSFISIHNFPASDNHPEPDVFYLIYDKEKNKIFRINPDGLKYAFFGAFGLTEDNILFLPAMPVALDGIDIWQETVEKQNLPFDIESNPVIFKIDLNKLILN